MTNTYEDDAPEYIKLNEELRCIRCVLERILRVMDEGMFTDYQMEKFGKKYSVEKQQIIYSPMMPFTTGVGNPCENCWWTRQLRDVYHGTYVGDVPCSWCPHGNWTVSQ